MSALANMARASALAICLAACFGCSETMTTHPPLEPALDTLRVTTWNIGYAGLGAESDFFKDGGERVLPPSRAIVRKNLQGVLDQLRAQDPDVVLLQEVAKQSFMTRYVRVEKALRTLFADRFYWFHADTRIPLLPSPVGIAHGLGVASIKAVERRSFRALPLEEGYVLGVLDREYALQIIELTPRDAARWVVINMHLAAFDKGGEVRKAQAKAALSIADAYYREGRHVVLGGDWNMELAIMESPRPTTEEYPFWLTPFDDALLPEGWRMAVDRNNPTVRTLIAAYQPGKTYTAIIDGFAYSPNVALERVETKDTGFVMSDHMPVTARFRALVE